MIIPSTFEILVEYFFICAILGFCLIIFMGVPMGVGLLVKRFSRNSKKIKDLLKLATDQEKLLWKYEKLLCAFNFKYELDLEEIQHLEKRITSQDELIFSLHKKYRELQTNLRPLSMEDLYMHYGSDN